MTIADIATLGIRVDARQVREADGALDRFGRTGRDTEQRIERTNAAMDRMRVMAASVAAALSVGELVKYADAWANLQGRLSLVTSGQEQLTRVTDQLFQSAQRTRSALGATVDLYGRITRSTQDLNKTDAQRLKVTETINKALTISGTSQEEAAGGLMQLGQAFASGALRGDEFNSVLESMPRLAEAIAAGMGKTTGQLRVLAGEGKLTSEVLFKSITNQAGAIDAEFAKLPATVGQAVTQIENSLLRTIGVFDQQNQLSRSLAQSMAVLADNIGLVLAVVATLAAAKLLSWLEGMVAGMLASARAAAAQRAALLATAQAEAQAAAAAVNVTAARLAEVRAATLAATGNVQLALTTNALIPAQNAHAAATARLDVSLLGLAVAQRAATIGSRALGAALAFTGGPIGLLVTILGVAATAWGVYESRQADANAKAAGDTEKSTAQIVADLDKQIEKMRERAHLAKQGDDAKDLAKQGGEAADNAGSILKRIEELKALQNAGTISPSDSVELITQQGLYDQLIGKVRTLKAETAAVAKQSDAEKLSDWMNKNTQYLDKAGKVAAAIAAAKKELGTAFNADVEKKIRDSFNKQDVEKARSTYDELVSSIREKIATQRLETAAGRDATDSQKEAIKFDEMQANSKKKLAADRAAVVRGLLSELAAEEQRNRQAQAQKDIDKDIAGGLLARQEAAAGLAVEYANYGKVTDARELDMIAVKNEFQLKRQLLDLEQRGVKVTSTMQEALRAETDERSRSERAIVAQSKALAYAEQLRQANQQFTVDYIVDPQAKADAQLAIDKAMWSSRIELAEQGTEARQRLEAEYGVWLQNQAIKPQLDAQMAMWSSIEQAARDAFVGMFSSGKDTFTRLRDSLKNTLYALLYEMTVKKWIISVQADVVGGLAGQAASGGGGGASGLLNTASTVKSLYQAGTGGLMNSVGTLVSGAGNAFSSIATFFGGSGAAGSSMSAFGAGLAGNSAGMATTASETFASLGMTSEATAAGYGATAGAALGVLGGVAGGVFGGRAISGGYGSNSAVNTGTAVGAAVGSIVPVLGTALGALIGGLVGGTYNRLFGRKAPEIEKQGIRGIIGTDGGVSGQSYQDIIEKGGVFKSDKRYDNDRALDAQEQSQIGQAFLAVTDASSAMAKTLGLGADALTGYTKTFDITLTDDAAKNQEAVAKFFGTVADEVASKLVPNLASFSQSGESASATLVRLAGEFEATTAAAQAIGRSAVDMFGSVGIESAKTRERFVQLAGGTGALGTLAANFAGAFLSDAEKLAPVTQALSDELGKLGLSSIPTTNEQFKALVQGLDVADEAQAKTLVTLLQLAPAFNQITAAADALAAKKDTLQAALLRAQGDEVGALAIERARELSAMDASLRPLQQRVWAVEDETKANEAATAAAEKAKQAYEAQLDAALAGIRRAVDAQKDIVKSAYDLAVKGLDASIDKTKTSVQTLTSLADSLHDAVKAAGLSAEADPKGTRAAAQAQIQTALAIARAGGPLPKLDDFKDVISAVTADSADQFSTFEEYQRDRMLTANSLAELAGMADDQLSDAERQLAALQAVRDATEAAYQAEIARLDNIVATAERQIDAVKGVDVSVQTVAAAVAGLQGLLGNNNLAAIIGAYGNSLGRAPDAAGLAYWQGQANNGTSIKDITAAIGNSQEATSGKVESLYQSVFGRNADAGGLAFWTEQMKNGVTIDQIRNELYGSDEYKDSLTSKPGSMSNARASAAPATSSTSNDATIAAALAKIASYTQRTAVAAEDQARAGYEEEDA